MKYKKKEKTIAFRLNLYTMMTLLVQTLLLMIILSAGGVFRQNRENAYISLQDKVQNRASYVQSELDKHWTNIDPYVRELSEYVTNADIYTDAEGRTQFFLQISDSMISMLRFSGVTGCFVVLDDNPNMFGRHSALYFRDYDPATAASQNRDLYLAAGPAQVSRELQIPMDNVWSYDLTLNKQNNAFYEKPRQAAHLTDDYRKLGYWSDPFYLTGDDIMIITYTVPLFDDKGQAHGVIGIEISVDFMKTILPSNELSGRDSPGYMIVKKKPDGTYKILVTTGSYQRRLMQGIDSPVFKETDDTRDIYEFINANSEEKIYGGMQKLQLYSRNTPYEDPGWILVGLVEESSLFDLVVRFQRALMASLLLTLLFSMVAGITVGHGITIPLVRTAENVKEYDGVSLTEFEKTGLAEIDGLLNAIERTNHNLVNTTIRMSQIMDLVNVRIGAFEYREDYDQAMVTNQIADMLGLPTDGGNSNYMDKNTFTGCVKEILKNPEPGEKNIYRLSEEPPKWVEINMKISGSECLGIIRDATQEMNEKYRIRQQRDYDFLTQIYGRAAFQREVEKLLESGTADIGALVMFDLDGLKQINDTWGHACGDLYLKETAIRLSRFPADRTVIGRRSGDEFCVFFYGCEYEEQIREYIRLFYEDLKDCPMSLPNGTNIFICISGGISWYGKDAAGLDELLEHADAALYEMKFSGKGNFKEYVRL